MIDPEHVINNIKISPETRSLVDAFVSDRNAGRRYLFGRNEHSIALSKVINIAGFVDDFAAPGSLCEGKPVVRGGAVPNQAIIVNCVMCNMPVSAGRRIHALRTAGELDYSDLCTALPDLVSPPDFVLETRADMLENLGKWRTLSASLHDDQSRQVLDDICRFRLTADKTSMTRYIYHPHDQYFESFLGLGPKEIFVDAGGFDGDTTESFIKRYPDYEKVYFFEPSLPNILKARTRLQGYRAIEFFQLGLSNTSGKSWFNADGGSASSICESGSCQIDLVTLDQQVEGNVTFIKMDLEGEELNALSGSKRHIIRDNPVLAIAVYHHPSDFWTIFDLVISLRQDFKVFLRHYTEGWSETIMYFVPR